MNQLTTYRWSFAEDVHHYQRAGFRAIGLWRRKVDDFGIERAAELLADSQLTVTHLSWAGGFTGNDGRSHEASLIDASRAIAQASQLGAPTLVVYAGGRNHHTLRHAERLLRSALDDLLLEAASYGVCLALKPVHPRLTNEWSFVASLSDTCDLIESYASPWLKLAIDTTHFAAVAESPELVNRLAPHMSLLQVGDTTGPVNLDQARCVLGTGRVDNATIVRRFRAAGYEGFTDIDLLGVCPHGHGYELLVSQSRAVTRHWSTIPVHSV